MEKLGLARQDSCVFDSVAASALVHIQHHGISQVAQGGNRECNSNLLPIC